MPSKLELIEAEAEKRAQQRPQRRRRRPHTATRGGEAKSQATRRFYEGMSKPKVSVTIKKKS